jgi:hypothetical protein
MSYIRSTEIDKAATRRHLLNADSARPHPYDGDDEQGRSWLGHIKGARLLDIQLLRASTMRELMAVSGRTELSVVSHFYHLRDKHGLEVVEQDGRYRLRVSECLPLNDFVYRMVLSGVKSA